MKLFETPEVVGEIILTGKNRITLPAKGIRALGWPVGTHLIVQVVDENAVILLISA